MTAPTLHLPGGALLLLCLVVVYSSVDAAQQQQGPPPPQQQQCPPSGFGPVPKFDLKAYASAPWFVQKQVRCSRW